MLHELNWGMPVILYLFLAGVGAGTVTVSASVLLRGGGGGFGGRHFAIARYGALIGPLPVIIGTLLLVFELGRPFRALNLFKLINLSPMNIGSWFLGLFIVVSVCCMPCCSCPGRRSSGIGCSPGARRWPGYASHWGSALLYTPA